MFVIKRVSRGSRAVAACVVGMLACSDSSPTEPEPLVVTFGETTLVVLVNPAVNDDNQTAVPTPGSSQSGVSVSVFGGPSESTDTSGVAVLSPVEPGTQALSVGGSDIMVSILDKDLREVAVALETGSASEMAEVRYAFGGQVVEITPSMSLAEVNDALSQSNTIVFFRAGTYAGDLQFSGSNVTLFGEGPTGGAVTLNGNVTVGGSGNRIRGARVTGNLSVPGSNVGVSFSRVSGDVQIDGSDATLLGNAFCGTVAISGSGLTALGNAGMSPVGPPGSAC